MKTGHWVAICIWSLIVLAAGAAVYKLWWVPSGEAKKELARQEAEKQILQGTSSSSKYKYSINLNVDAFSGYAAIRAQQMQNHCRRQNIQLNLVDDKADYVQRLKDVSSGQSQMAVFTIDALIKACDELGTTAQTIPPIVAHIDETRGGDMIVAYKKAFPNLDALNDPAVRFVLTPNSPSETLARITLSNFQFDQLPNEPFIKVDSAQAVFEKYRASKDTDKQVYVVWQPYGTKILDNPNTHILIDSSRFKGYIVDVFVANRDFLYKNPDVVRSVVESYYRSLYENTDRMIDLVIEDAAVSGQPVSKTQAEQLVKGIWWKNTQENYAHFGLGTQTLQHTEDMILNLVAVLRKSGSIKGDPTNGQPNVMYFDGIARKMHDINFHPGFEPEAIRTEDRKLGPLNDDQWQRLIPVGTLDVPKLVFRRGSDVLTDASKSHLDSLVKTLNTFPTYYIVIKGDASTEGDIDANQQLALSRANSALQYLTSQGINQDRIRAVAGMPSGETSVRFQLGESPY